MKWMMGAALTMMIGLAAPAASAQELTDATIREALQEMKAKEKLQATYLKELKKLGYEGEIDSDGDIAFTISEDGRDKNYFIRVDPSDPQYMTVVFPSFWPIESEEEGFAVRLVGAEVTGEVKVAKIYVVGGSAWAAVEMFNSKPKEFFKNFDRSLGAIDSAVSNFVAGMRALNE